MPRKILQRSSIFPYHVCNKTIDGAFYPVDKKQLWQKACDLLCTLAWVYDVRAHAFVLMNNHYHLLTSTPSENLDSGMQYFQSNFSRWLMEKTTKGIYAFKSRYNWSIIRDPQHYMNVYKYIYQNPVRAGLVDRAEDYEFSTLNGKYGLSKLECPIARHDFDACIPETGDEELEWLNLKMTTETSDKIRSGLKRSIFCPPLRNRILPKGVGRVAKGA